MHVALFSKALKACSRIETQDVILDKLRTERVIEIGPGSTLVNMVKRTIASKWEVHDQALGMERHLLSFASDRDRIYYKQDVAAENAKVGQVPEQNPAASSLTVAATTLAKKETSFEQVERATAIPDEPLDSTDIILMIICTKLKKSLSDIPLTSTIKELAQGRSTMQNEIIGDLEKELGQLPDSPEDIPLVDLGSLVPSEAGKVLGKVTKSQIQRMVSLKMPSGFTITTIGNYLQRRWGLGNGRRDAVLLIAISVQPGSRISTEQEAYAFLDKSTQTYASRKGLDLSARKENGQGNISSGETVDPKVMKNLQKQQNALIRRKMELNAEHLGLDLHAPDHLIQELKSTILTQRKQLDDWDLEHGEEYASGIRSQFNPLMVRQYDSSWAWGLQGFLEVCHDLALSSESKDSKRIQLRIQHIMNCLNMPLIRAINYDARRFKRGEYRLEVTKGVQQLINSSAKTSPATPVVKILPPFKRPRTSIDLSGNIIYSEEIRGSISSSTEWATDLADHAGLRIVVQTIGTERVSAGLERYQCAEPKNSSPWCVDEDLTSEYMKLLCTAGTHGLSFANRTILMTGAGKYSIGEKVLKGFLGGGARVIVATSSFSYETIKRFQRIYTTRGALESRLVVVPINQGSRRDVGALTSYIYESLGWDLDLVLPFAAVSENGREIDEIDAKSELAHRLMLTNTIRLLGEIMHQKRSRGIQTRPAQVILPLSENHGDFGGDGLYAESKIGLETLFKKWYSENWGSYLSICGAKIGWTRGSGLMHGNDIIAEGIEMLGARTFSRNEMAFFILALCTGSVRSRCEDQPILVDLNGRLETIRDLSRALGQIRGNLLEISDTKKAIARGKEIEATIAVGNQSLHDLIKLEPRPSIEFQFPKVLEYREEKQALTPDLRGMVDLSRVVVITGFAEVSPLGNARTRWEKECHGEFSDSGCIELAWIMGLIKHGTMPSKEYSGWLDSKTNEPVADKDVKKIYEPYMLENTGIRIVRQEDGQPPKWQTLQEVVTQEAMAPFETSKEIADAFKMQHGVNVDIREIAGSGNHEVCVKKGATLLLPKATQSPQVAGQLPTGWNARTFGIPENIISQVDQGTLDVLVCAAEALLAAGVTDPYEFYKHIHVSEFGNCIGSGIGGSQSLEKMFKHRLLDKDVQGDILQETFSNTPAAWVNMLLLSSSGPIKTPVGACATSLESLESGYESIISQKAKVCLVGGFDHLQENISHEFGNMRATVDVQDEISHGRLPSEMSRPTTHTRNGFIESEGCGIQVITSAKLAIEMGLPIYGIVAMAETSSDKISRSVPTPGLGVMVNAREISSPLPPLMLDIHYRRRQLDFRLQQIRESLEDGLDWVEDSLREAALKDNAINSLRVPEHREALKKELVLQAEKEEREARYTTGTHFWKGDSRIAPLRGALATWGLNIDDLDIASMHGTSTQKNDENETRILHQQLHTLGRSPGNPIIAVCQKHLTGHGKGAAGAWMINGCLQMLESGFIPGNHNADNIDSALQAYDHVAFLNSGIQTAGVKACSVTSFGFGQKGAQAVLVHPRYLFSTLEETAYEEYRDKVNKREKKAYRYFHEAIVTNSLFRAKEKPPYDKEKELSFLVDPEARV